MNKKTPSTDNTKSQKTESTSTAQQHKKVILNEIVKKLRKIKTGKNRSKPSIIYKDKQTYLHKYYTTLPLFTKT